MSEEQMKLPGDESMGGRGSQKGGRPSNKQLDAREAGLDVQATNLDEREEDLQRRERDLASRMNDDRPAPQEPKPMADDAELGPHMRQPVDAQRETHGLDNPKAIRKGIGHAKRLDADIYIPMYPGKVLMWVNDISGGVQRWIEYGAEPVPIATRASKVFEGITDAKEGKWVRAIGGDNGSGGHYWVYLLMIERETYIEVKVLPEKLRQQMIRDAIITGMDRSDYSLGPKLPSYAPNLPTGSGQGFSETRETIAQENS